MFFVLSKIFEFLAAPAHLAMFLAASGAGLLFTRCWRWGRRLAAISAIGLLLMGFGPVGHLLAVPLETRFPAPPEDMPPPDGIVVLGGSIDENLSEELGRTVFVDAVERLTAPIALMRRFPNARLVFTGGSAALRESRRTEAQAVRRFWLEAGVDRGNVLYEDRSRNTHENAVFTRELVRPQPGERWLLVTSAMHMPRSVGIFRQAGFPVVAYPVAYRTTGRWLGWGFPRYPVKALVLVDLAAHEWAGLIVYRLTGRSDSFFPAP
jgi:uncharacterized SAM-binding protein YcdF (DUF218 family)